MVIVMFSYLVITFNYKEGTKTITFAEIEEAFGSDLSSLTAPKKSSFFGTGIFYPSRRLGMESKRRAHDLLFPAAWFHTMLRIGDNQVFGAYFAETKAWHGHTFLL